MTLGAYKKIRDEQNWISPSELRKNPMGPVELNTKLPNNFTFKYRQGSKACEFPLSPLSYQKVGTK